MSSAIPYLDVNWPVTTGCLPDFPCWQRCWARAMDHRFAHVGNVVGTFKPTFHAGRLAQPLHWRKPRRVGVAFTGDLFVDGITDEQIAAVFGVMAACPQHTFYVITKRAERMAAWFARDVDWPAECGEAASSALGEGGFTAIAYLPLAWPLPNVVLLVSVSTEPEAEERIKWLLRCPAAVHGVSAEPLLGPIDFGRLRYHLTRPGTEGVNWVVAAAESGPRARPLNLDWVRKIRDDCAENGCAFSFKNQTGYPPLDGVVHNALPGRP